MSHPSQQAVSSVVSGQVAVVTGASDGIGKAIAMGLAGAGVKVALGARRKDKLDEMVKEIVASGGQAIAVQTDVVVRQQVKHLVSEAEAAFGPVDILVSNAGVYYLTLMKNVKEDAWDRMVDVNVKGLLNGIGAVLERMAARGKGHIVTISSDSGREGTQGMAVYSGTKFFVEGMSQAMRKELAGLGVKVTSIQPGYVDTPGIKDVLDFDLEALSIMGDQQDITMMQPVDIANAVLYAVSQPVNVAVNEILVQATKQGAIPPTTTTTTSTK